MSTAESSTQRRRSTMRGGRYRDCGQRIVGKFDPIESPQMGFTGGRKTKTRRDETRRVDISGSACTRANSRDLWRTDAPLNIDFSISPILDTPANIADRWWHSMVAPNLSRLSYTSTDFFKLIPLRRERSSESFGEIRYRLSSFLSNARFFSFFVD